MPFSISSITFADDINTGTTTELNSANVGDAITTTIQLDYSNIIDASIYGSESIRALDSSNVTGYGTGGLQAFEVPSSLRIYYRAQWNEYSINNTSFEITASGFGGAVDGVYTFKEIDGTFIICNEANTGNNAGNNGVLAITEAITTCDIDYRLNGTSNDGVYEPPIKIFNSNQAVNFKTTDTDLDALSGSVIPIPFTYQSANNTGSLTISGLGIASNIQSFELIHTFDVAPVSVYQTQSARQPSDLQLNNNVYSNVFQDDGKVKYGYNGIFGNAVNGGFKAPINYSINDELKSLLGNLSTFSRKYGGGSTNYSYSNFSIVRTSDSEVSNVPLIAAKFTVSFDIDNATDTPFSNSNTKVKVGLEYIPQDIDNSEDGEQTFLRDSAINTLGAGAVSGVATGDAASITNYTCTFNSTSQASVSFDVEWNAGAQAQIDSDYFSIYFTTQNHLLGYSDSDKVTLQVFKGLGINNILLDPITVNDTQFITSPYQDFSTGINASDIDGFSVQMLVGSTEFSADWTSRTDLRIDNVSQLLVLKNSSTLEEINLESTNIPVNTFTLIDSEYPNANYSVQKGFKIPSNEVRNLIEMTNVSDVSSVRTFEVRFPFFIRWEDYSFLLMNPIPSSIIDNSEPFDGQNYDVNRIDDLANWSLNYRITIDCSESGTTFSQDFDYTIPTSGYNAHPDITARSITSYKPDGTTLQPTLASGKQAVNSIENTWLKYEATFSTPPSAITDFEIEIFAEAFENGSPVRIERISSVNNLLSSSWFTDTGAGDGKILKSIDGSKAVGDCLIDFSKLAQFDSYRLYGQIYDPKRPTEYILAENGDNLVTESGDRIIRDF